MTDSHSHRTRFHGFEFDIERLAVYFNGELVKVEKKAIEVLAVLVRQANSLVGTQEIIDEVWRDSPHGITPMHVSQTIRKLRKAFAEIDPETTFIQTVKGSGYIFLPKLETAEVEPRAITGAAVADAKPLRSAAPQSSRKLQMVAAVGLAIGILFIAAWMLYPASNAESEVRRVVEESQRYESLVLYRDPESFEESDLDQYWTAEIDPGSNYDRKNIRTGARKMIEDGRSYGPETKNEQFEFQSVEVNANGDMAVVKTLEEWFIAEYRKDGSLIKNKTVGPYFVSYVVRKIDGRWLIEKSTTARATPVPPTLITIEPKSPLKAGTQSFVKIEGVGFNPQNVFLRVIGPGCAPDSPCSVPNSALRIHSEVTENRLTNVPLTLASGEFSISVHNGESPPSNSLMLMVE